MSQKPSETSKLEERMGEFKPFSDSPSCSRSITETVDGSHKFTIKGYSLTKGIGAGKYIMSDTFSVGGYDWAIYFYPEGKNPEDNCLYVSVFIALASEGTNVRALFKLTLEDQNEKGNDKVHYYFDRPLESGPCTLKYRGCMWGYKRFFRRTMLETSEYLKDDCLVMHCSVGVVKTRFEGTKQSIIVPQSDMAQNFNDFFESEVGCDILFKVGNESFKAHKLILAARSPVFRAQFFGLVGDPSMKEEVIDDIEPFIFKVMLLYIYTDELPDMYDDKDSMSLWSHTAMVQHLLAAADRYYLDRLKLLCESKLCEEINTGTVSTTLALAEKHHCPQLKAICLKFIANPSNLGVVMQSESFMHLKESCPSVLLELLETFASVDENSIRTLSKKRNGGSIYGQDLEDGRAAESVNPNGRRIRRRT